MDCVFAHTETSGYDHYPAYINLSRVDDAGNLCVTVRSRDKGGNQQATITITPQDAEALAVKLLEYLGPGI